MQSLGVGRGDRVLIYMPMIPEAAFAMLACARIGAIHSVVFGGFAAASLATRIDDARPKVIVSADAGMRAGKAVPYKHLLDEAIRLAQHPPQKVRHGQPRHRHGDAARRRARRRLRGAARKAHERAGARRLAGVERALVHPLHLGHHRQAQGRAARRRRLLRGAGRLDEAHLLRHAGRDHVHHLRHRLGGRAFLHHLRAADRRHDHHHVRGHADPPGCRDLVEDRRRTTRSR